MAKISELRNAGSIETATAIEEIAGIVRDSVKTTVLNVAGEPPGTYYLVGPDGKAERKVAAPGWHDERLETPAMLLKYVQDRTDSAGAIYVNEDRVIYLIDREDRRHKARCELTWTPQFRWLEQESHKALTQTDIVRLLRITFRDCLPSDSTLLSLLKNIKFQASTEGGMKIEHGRESLGKNIAAAVNAENAIPEEIALTVPVYENFPFTDTVVCAIEITPSDQRFKLTPYPIELRKVKDKTLAAVAELFDESEVPVYRGQP